jgi:hypothetical protein
VARLESQLHTLPNDPMPLELDLTTQQLVAKSDRHLLLIFASASVLSLQLYALTGTSMRLGTCPMLPQFLASPIPGIGSAQRTYWRRGSLTIENCDRRLVSRHIPALDSKSPC